MKEDAAVPYRVLLVDDEPWALQDLEVSFPWEKYGFRVAEKYTNPEEALRAIVSMRPEVVVTDVRMPGLKGVDLLRRAREEGLATVFVLVSGVSDFEAAREGIRWGAVEYCMKPLDEEECEKLVQRVAALLDAPADREAVSAQVRAIQDYIDANLHRKLTLPDTAAHFHISPNSLGRIFRAEMNTTFGQYLEDRRMKMAERLLAEKRLSIGEIADRLGFSDQNYFAVCFKRRHHQTPMQFRTAAGKRGP